MPTTPLNLQEDCFCRVAPSLLFSFDQATHTYLERSGWLRRRRGNMWGKRAPRYHLFPPWGRKACF